MTVQENYMRVKQNIEEACKRSGRSIEDVTVVAVTKTVGIEKTREVLASGIEHLGENRNEGFLPKYEVIGADAVWHFIGSLQTRKVKDIINQIHYLHSLDRISLAQEIQKRAEHCISCFVQVKTSNEETKQGLEPNELLPFIQELASFDHIHVVGLMTMAPHTSDEEEIRTCFQMLKKLQQDVQALDMPHAPCRELSMGMSNDYAIAVEEGATYIRLGTILVG
ncbi:YggS family pyridoxal phosphate-dependent enzyme [Ectobacillus funiculus]|uniref:Pyridoxal phosphate homeostasis protein n=1 Tax=Ectobacillus funiculus TaxID=137993 RepID=A0ABV5WNN1_9BACI